MSIDMTHDPSDAELEQLALELGERLRERGMKLATAESCTGGWIAQCMTAIAGSSDWFECGWVTYSNLAKHQMLGVDAMTLERYGAVSVETAAQMADGARRGSGVELAVAVTGVAGPSGGSADKPVGTVCFGFAMTARATTSARLHFMGSRRAVRAQSVKYALVTLLAMLD
jgi:nicotinamide-nucleotide amidase